MMDASIGKIARALLSCLLVLSCIGETRKAHPPAPSLSSLEAKAALYKEALPGAADASGFLFTERCDSLLWSGLYGAAATGSVSLTAAEVSSGKWLRRPPQYGLCARPLSRDSLRGVLYWAVFNNYPDVITRLWQFIKEAKGFADSGADSLITPQFAGLISRTLQYMGTCDEECRLTALIENTWEMNTLGYESHLQVLDGILETHISGGQVPEGAVHRASEAWVRNPTNPLLAAAVYRFTGAEEARVLAEGALSDSSRWPDDRLPSGDTICDEWPTQREPGPDWGPCPNWDEGRRVPDYRGAGAAWLFSYFVLTSDKIGRGGPSTHEAIRSAITQAGDGATRMYRRGTSASGLSTKWDRKSRGSAQKGLENWEDNHVAPAP